MKTKFEVEEELDILIGVEDDCCSESEEKYLKVKGWIEALEWVLADGEEVNKQIEGIKHSLELLKSTVKNVVPPKKYRVDEKPF